MIIDAKVPPINDKFHGLLFVKRLGFLNFVFLETCPLVIKQTKLMEDELIYWIFGIDWTVMIVISFQHK